MNLGVITLRCECCEFPGPQEAKEPSASCCPEHDRHCWGEGSWLTILSLDVERHPIPGLEEDLPAGCICQGTGMEEDMVVQYSNRAGYIVRTAQEKSRQA